MAHSAMRMAGVFLSIASPGLGAVPIASATKHDAFLCYRRRHQTDHALSRITCRARRVSSDPSNNSRI